MTIFAIAAILVVGFMLVGRRAGAWAKKQEEKVAFSQTGVPHEGKTSD